MNPNTTIIHQNVSGLLFIIDDRLMMLHQYRIPKHMLTITHYSRQSQKYSDERYNQYITYTNVVSELYITYIN